VLDILVEFLELGEHVGVVLADVVGDGGEVIGEDFAFGIVGKELAGMDAVLVKKSDGAAEFGGFGDAESVGDEGGGDADGIEDITDVMEDAGSDLGFTGEAGSFDEAGLDIGSAETVAIGIGPDSIGVAIIEADKAPPLAVDADGEVAVGDLADDAMEVDDGLDEAAGVVGGGDEADEDTGDDDEAGSLVDGTEVEVVGLEGEADMDPAPFDAGRIEGVAIVEGALLEDGTGAERGGRDTRIRGGQGGERGFGAPAMAFGDDGGPVGFGNDQIIDGGITANPLMALVSYVGDIEVGGGLGDGIAEGDGDT
jgi:hypothetical protein